MIHCFLIKARDTHFFFRFFRIFRCANIIDVRRIFPRDKPSVLYYRYFKIDPPNPRESETLVVCD